MTAESASSRRATLAAAASAKGNSGARDRVEAIRVNCEPSRAAERLNSYAAIVLLMGSPITVKPVPPCGSWKASVICR